MFLYAVTDRMWLGEKSLAQQVEESIKGGVTFVQLREKNLPYNEFVKIAKEIKVVTDLYDIPFVINDNLEVAEACHAHGAHIGQSDMSASDARYRLGNNKVLGVSVQTVEQAIEAVEMGADYLGVGAVFSTSTKGDADQVTLDILKDICHAVSIPVVAIGGIDKENIGKLEGSGVAGVAVVSAIFAQKDILASTKELYQLVCKVVNG